MLRKTLAKADRKTRTRTVRERNTRTRDWGIFAHLNGGQLAVHYRTLQVHIHAVQRVHGLQKDEAWSGKEEKRKAQKKTA